MTVTTEQFLRQIHELQLVPQAVLRSTLRPSERNARAPEDVAEILLREGRLTQFQVDCLLNGTGQQLVLDAYVVEELLGCGGIGRVYRARHRMMQRDVAVKVLSQKILAKRSARSRFQREMQLAARLTHPNLVMSFDAGEHSGEPYLVMEYIPGPNLQQLVKERGTLDSKQAIEILIQVSRGLEYAHNQGIIHRDIKPSNLILDPAGTAKVLDLGLAHHLSQPEESSNGVLLDTGAIVGTPDFMSPEQSIDFRQIDERTDIYSLGCTLFYLLTGRPLFERDSALKKIHAHRNETAPSLLEYRDDVSLELEAIYERMIAKDRAERFPSATALREALEHLTQANAENAIQGLPIQRDLSAGQSERKNPTVERPFAINWRILLLSMLAFLAILIGVDRFRNAPQNFLERSSGAGGKSPSLPPGNTSSPPQFSANDFGFALEFDGRSHIALPVYQFEEDHVVIVELDLTPLRRDLLETQSVFVHSDSQLGWQLRIRDEYWSLCLGEGDFPLVQLNSVEPVRSGKLSHLSIVVHPGFAGLYLDGQIQAEWEGVAEFLPASAPMTVGTADSSPGFVGKIQTIKLSKAEHLLVDENGRRLLPDARETVAEYRFEEGEGSLLGDTSGAERHGTIGGAVWSFSD